MPTGIDRREILKGIGAAALVSSAPSRSAGAQPKFSRMPSETRDTPKLCLGFWQSVDEPGMRRVKQIGIDHVLTGGPRIPWDEAEVRARIERFKAGGLTLCNMMISGFDDVIWGRPGADAQIEQVIASIRAAGRAGLPVIEYNFYANRLMEGYKEEIGRAGAGYTAYDYELSKSLPPKDGVGTHTRAEQLKRAERFLATSIPAAAGSPARSTTWATPGRCCRRR
jgi:mannonate dehydratase